MPDRISLEKLVKDLDAEIQKLQERRAWLLEQRKKAPTRKPRAVSKPDTAA